jgi:hypothetical protein
MAIKGKQNAPRFVEVKPKDILQLIYKPEGMQKKLTQGLAWS